MIPIFSISISKFKTLVMFVLVLEIKVSLEKCLWCWDGFNSIYRAKHTQRWRSREIKATGGHSSILLDRRLNPRQESRDAGEDGELLLAAALSKPFAHDPNKNVGTILICCCEWPATVTLS